MPTPTRDRGNKSKPQPSGPLGELSLALDDLRRRLDLWAVLRDELAEAAALDAARAGVADAWAAWGPAVDRARALLADRSEALVRQGFAAGEWAGAVGAMASIFAPPIVTLRHEGPGWHLTRPRGALRAWPGERLVAADSTIARAVEALRGSADVPEAGGKARPGGWTRSELCELATIGDSTFDRLRVNADIVSGTRGGGGAMRRYSRDQIRQLVDAADRRGTPKALAAAAAWRALLDG